MDIMTAGIEEMRRRFGSPTVDRRGGSFGPLELTAPPERVVCLPDGRTGASIDQVGAAEYLRDIGFRYVDGMIRRFDGCFLRAATKQDMMDALVMAVRTVGFRLMVPTGVRDNIVAYWASIANPENMAGGSTAEELEEYEGWLIPFENGIYNVGRARMLPFSPDVMFMGCIRARFDPGKALDRKVDRRMRGLYMNIFRDEDLFSFFLLATGYTLYSETLVPPAIFILLGGGETGKSAILNVLETLLGSDRVCNLSPAKLSTQFGLSRLRGMAANLCDESGAKGRGAFIDGDLLKAISAGRPWDSEQKFKDIEKYQNTAKLWFAANSMPDLGDTSSGMMRRVYVLPCLYRQRSSEMIYDAMTTPEGLSWLAYASLEAFVRFRWEGRNEFPVPEVMMKYREDFGTQDTVNDFIYDACRTVENRDVVRKWLMGKSLNDLYDEYRDYAMLGGRAMPVTRNTFKSRLCTEYLMELKRRFTDSGGVRTSWLEFSPLPIMPRYDDDDGEDGSDGRRRRKA